MTSLMVLTLRMALDAVVVVTLSHYINHRDSNPKETTFRKKKSFWIRTDRKVIHIGSIVSKAIGPIMLNSKTYQLWTQEISSRLDSRIEGHLQQGDRRSNCLACRTKGKERLVRMVPTGSVNQ